MPAVPLYPALRVEVAASLAGAAALAQVASVVAVVRFQPPEWLTEVARVRSDAETPAVAVLLPSAMAPVVRFPRPGVPTEVV